jgi:hypothetical protein
MRPYLLSHYSRRVVAATTLLVVACHVDTFVVPPFEPRIVNKSDDFSFEANDLDGVIYVLEYTWQNTGTLGKVTQSSSVSTPAGSATLTIFDGSRTQIYSRSLTEVGTFTSAASGAGTWRIRVILWDFRGTLNFRVQKGG